MDDKKDFKVERKFTSKRKRFSPVRGISSGLDMFRHQGKIVTLVGLTACSSQSRVHAQNARENTSSALRGMLSVCANLLTQS